MITQNAAQQSIIGVNEQDGAIAVSKKTAAKIPADAICTERYFGDFGGFACDLLMNDAGHIIPLKMKALPPYTAAIFVF